MHNEEYLHCLYQAVSVDLVKSLEDTTCFGRRVFIGNQILRTVIGGRRKVATVGMSHMFSNIHETIIHLSGIGNLN